MKSGFSSTPVIFILILVVGINALNLGCKSEKSALETIEPVKMYFENLSAKEITHPDLSAIEVTEGVILTWHVTLDDSTPPGQYSWVLAKNTDDLKKALIIFDSARAWNTGSYILLPVSIPALDVHAEAGLTVPKAIYDEDGMNRIREIVLSGKAPEGGFVEQFEQFME